MPRSKNVRQVGRTFAISTPIERRILLDRGGERTGSYFPHFLKNVLLLSGSGLIVSAPGRQLAGQTSPFFS